jgi:hypothetical protein
MSGRYSDLTHIFIMDMCRYRAQYRDAITVSARMAWPRQGAMLTAIFSHAADRSGLKAD